MDAYALAYSTGIAAGIVLLCLFGYAVRKNAKFCRYWGAMKYWFWAHMTLGIVMPILVLYHSNFGSRSLNGRVALWSMILVVCSGIVGRFLLRRVSHGTLWRRLFSWWHVIHVPFLLMLAVAVLFHIYAVHAY